MSLPFIPPELLAAIERHYPVQAPDPEKSDRYVWIEAGKQSVVSFLREQSRSRFV